MTTTTLTSPLTPLPSLAPSHAYSHAYSDAPSALTITGAPDGLTLDQIIAVWLHAKASRTGSARTRKDYATILASARALLARAGIDLDTPDAPTLATLFQGWAGQPRSDGAPVKATTYNLRLAVVASFYAFARKRRLLACENPVDLLDRRPAQDYASARPLPASAVGEHLAAIDRTSLAGMRDYALLAVMLITGRRLAEIAALRWGDVACQGMQGETVTLTFAHAKGAKVLYDTLPTPVAGALLAWLGSYYGDLASLAPDAPVWVALARGSRRGGAVHGQPMGVQSIADVCQKRLGTSKAHATRHTFAHDMQAAGAPVSEIQRRLGHASLATTTRYLDALRSAENIYAESLAARWGLR